MPEETIDAFQDHGKVELTLEQRLDEARSALERARRGSASTTTTSPRRSSRRAWRSSTSRSPSCSTESAPSAASWSAPDARRTGGSRAHGRQHGRAPAPPRARGRDLRATDPARTVTSLEELVSKLEAPRVAWMMVPAGDATEGAFPTLLGLLEPGDVLVDGGNSNFRDSQRRAAEAQREGHPLPRRRRVGRHLGPGGRLLPHGRRRRRRRRGVEPLFKTLAPRGRLRPRRRDRRRPLHEDGPQRDRVRDDAGLRGGLRDPEGLRVRSRPAADRRLWRYGSVVRSWLLELLERAFEQDAAKLERDRAATSRTRAKAAGRRPRRSTRTCPRRSSRSALFARFASRQDDSFAAKVIAALRNQFGGHAVEGRVRRARPMTVAVTQREPAARGPALRRRPEPCTLVIFGASGDLTAAQALPGALRARAGGCCPSGSPSSASRARRSTDDDFRERMKEARRSSYARDAFRQEVWDELADRHALRALDVADEDGEDSARRGCLDRARRRARHCAATASSTSPSRRARSRPLVEADRPSAATAEGWTRLIIEKPFGHDLASARELNATARGALRRARDLPHRPLPRQGDRAEHAGAPLRERHLRADLEPPVHRPRADHGGRVDRASRAAAPSTSRPARSATSSRTTCCSSRAHGDGAADRLHGRRRCATRR